MQVEARILASVGADDDGLQIWYYSCYRVTLPDDTALPAVPTLLLDMEEQGVLTELPNFLFAGPQARGALANDLPAPTVGQDGILRTFCLVAKGCQVAVFRATNDPPNTATQGDDGAGWQVVDPQGSPIMPDVYMYQVQARIAAWAWADSQN